MYQCLVKREYSLSLPHLSNQGLQVLFRVFSYNTSFSVPLESLSLNLLSAMFGRWIMYFKATVSDLNIVS